MDGRIYTKDSLPDAEFAEYIKMRVTRAAKIDGMFHCVTSEGNVASCSDGWLAIDSRGFPYPVNSLEFESTYQMVHGSDATEA
jgi:hypothetical protein